VSPLWRDEVIVYLAPRKVAVARRARGIRPHVTASTEVAVPNGSIADSGPSIDKLSEVLLEPTWHDALVRVVVADPWARFAVVPSSAARLDGEGRRQHARCLLADAFGDSVADWTVALEDCPPGRMAVACAMPPRVQPALESALTAGRMKLVSLQPHLVVAYNAWRPRLPRDDSWFITLEEGWLSALHIAGGVWDRVHMARLSSDPSVDLDRLQAFGRVTRAAGSSERMFVEAPQWIRDRAKRVGTELEWLEAEDGDAGPAHELALLVRASA
jgi:hypothetical protein